MRYVIATDRYSLGARRVPVRQTWQVVRRLFARTMRNGSGVLGLAGRSTTGGA